MSSEEQVIAEIKANSYKNFHAKGLDYICVYRSDNCTIKYYFFDGDHTKLPEVVNPHNHRYTFTSKVLAGGVIDHLFIPVEKGGTVYNKFDWLTPLNGGNGFTYAGEQQLQKIRSKSLDKAHTSRFHDIHTIQITKDQTVLSLVQLHDMVGLTEPTQLFSLNDAAPDTSGLYEQFTEDEIRTRLQQIAKLKRL